MHVPAPVARPANSLERCVALVRRRVRVPEASANVSRSPVPRRWPRARARIRPSRLRIASLALFNDAGRIYAPFRIRQAHSPPRLRRKNMGHFRSFHGRVEVGDGETACASRHRRRPRSNFAHTLRWAFGIVLRRFRARAGGLKFHNSAQLCFWSKRPPTSSPVEDWYRPPARTPCLRPS